MRVTRLENHNRTLAALDAWPIPVVHALAAARALRDGAHGAAGGRDVLRHRGREGEHLKRYVREEVRV